MLPVYGSREVLWELHRRVSAALESHGASWEMILVEDACPEGSVETLEQIAREDDRVVVLALERNVGQHEAVRIGLLHARGVAVVVMDADLQDPPEAIPALLCRLEEGVSAVFAGRRGVYESRERSFTSALFKRILALVCGVPRDAGMHVAVDRRMLEAALANGRRGFYLVAAIGLSGLPMDTVPVVRQTDPTGSSGYSRLRRLRMALRLLGWACVRRLGIGRASASPEPPEVRYRRIGGTEIVSHFR